MPPGYVDRFGGHQLLLVRRADEEILILSSSARTLEPGTVVGMRSTSRAVLLVIALALPIVAVLTSFALTDSPRSPHVPPIVEVGSSPAAPGPPGGTPPADNGPNAPGELPPPPPNSGDDADDDRDDRNDRDDRDDRNDDD